MFKVECEGCHAPYQVDERRVPPAGLKMRCPKCGTTFVVRKPDDEVSGVGPAPVLGTGASAPRPPLPSSSGGAKPAPPGPPPKGPPPVPRPGAPRMKQTMVGLGDAAALAAAAVAPKPPPAPRPAPPGPPPSRRMTAEFGAEIDDIDLAELPAPVPKPSARGRTATGLAPTAPPRFDDLTSAELDLNAAEAELPAPAPFGDLPMPAAGRADLPASIASKAELPSPVARGLDLPAPAAAGPAARAVDPLGFGEIDLPSPAAELPASGGGLGLPAPAAAVGLPAPAAGFDFPSPAGLGLPTPTGIGLPSRAAAGLPSPAAGLPTPAAAGLPSFSAGLPVRSTTSEAAIGFGEIDLPLVGAGEGAPPPAPAAPPFDSFRPPAPPAGGLAHGAASDLPPALGGGIPAPPPSAFDFDFDAPPPPPLGAASTVGDSRPPPSFGSQPPPAFGAASLPPGPAGDPFALPAEPPPPSTDASSAFGAPSDAPPRPHASSPPAAPEAAAAITRQAGGGTAFGEVDLGGGGGDDDMEFGAIPQEKDGPADVAAPSAPSMPAPDVAPALKAPAVRPAVVELPKKTSRRTQAIGAVVALALIGGGALEFTAFGAFGRHAIMDAVNKDRYAAILASSIDGGHKALGADTFSEAKKTLAAIDAAHASTPRVHGLLAYAAFAGYATELRFGRDAAMDAHAKQQLSEVPADETNRPVELARSAQAAVSSQLPRARQLVDAIVRRDPHDIDAAVLAGEIELLAKDNAKAVEAWKRAVQIDHGSPRTLFGLARALLASGDEKGALEQADAVLKLSPNHVGARILYARAIWAAKGDEATAMKMLGAIIAPGPVLDAASPSERVDALTQLGRLHIARSRITEAERVLGDALKLDPKAGAALAGLGEVYYREGRFTDALARFEAGIQADPDGVSAKIGAAKTKIALERLQDAKDMLKKLRDARPNDVEVAFWLGRAEELLGDKTAAEAEYAEAIKVGGSRPEVVEPYVALSQLLAATGRAADAEAKLAEARQKLPDSAAIHKALGDVDLTAGRYDDAKNEFELARKLDPGDLAAVFKLGVTLRHMKKFDEASAMFDAVGTADKDYPGLPLERGLLYEASDRTRDALEFYRQALAKAPDDPDMMLRVGSALVAAGQAEQAEEMLKKVLAKRPNSAEANHYLGRALLLRGANLAEALRYLSRAIDIDPNRAEYYLYRGWAANDAGQPGVAQESLTKALELDKSLADAYWQMGVLLRKQGAVVDAVRDLQMALKLRPSRFEAYATLAECYEDQVNFAAAQAAWQKALAGDPNRPYWHYRLGKLLGTRGLGELQAAVKQEEEKPQKEAWLSQAYFELAEAEYAAGRRGEAKEHYLRFLNVGRQDSPYRADAIKKLSSMGVRYDQL